ncbi:hypothetical protein P154DRAFT_520751 [Amniculicola lignicola CBS 123094]|uniref:Uncharacterized protein n=1 Tax=Amniculicola lignicola CBS 123094 TaxID=1392246 RepID=A0A6A5WNN4_9PLEO|nr:hypothetical protein P154DRAFT_520751 [Amniculicola lignicola CBS 123094]
MHKFVPFIVITTIRLFFTILILTLPNLFVARFPLPLPPNLRSLSLPNTPNALLLTPILRTTSSHRTSPSPLSPYISSSTPLTTGGIGYPFTSGLLIVKSARSIPIFIILTISAYSVPGFMISSSTSP